MSVLCVCACACVNLHACVTEQPVSLARTYTLALTWCRAYRSSTAFTFPVTERGNSW